MAWVCGYCTVEAQNYMVGVAVMSVGLLHWLRDQAERNRSPAMPEAAQTVLFRHELGETPPSSDTARTQPSLRITSAISERFSPSGSAGLSGRGH